MTLNWSISILFVTALALTGCGKPIYTFNSSQNQQGPSASGEPVGVPSTAANSVVCPSTGSISGADISDNNPVTSWTSIGTAGLSFVFIKATEGTSIVNSDFVTDWQSAPNTAHLVRGAYHYYHPDEDPTAQANLFLQTIGTLQATDLPPVLDWEETDDESSAIQIQNALIWLQTVENATGKIPIIYVDPSFWNALGNPQGFQRYPLYIANYDVTCPSVPPPWSNWAFWQKTDTGTISGIQGDVDEDVFNGSLANIFDEPQFK